MLNLQTHSYSKPSEGRLAPQGGYILSLMFILILTIVGIGLFVGVSAVKDAWFKEHEFDRSVQVTVLYDDDGTPGGTATVLGHAVDFDEHETPLIPFIDFNQYYSATDSNINYRSLIGVRDDRFTTPDRVYYTSPDCTTDDPDEYACVFIPSAEYSYREGISYQQAVRSAPSIAFGTPSGTGTDTGEKTYAVGRNEDNGGLFVWDTSNTDADNGLPGWLYRQTSQTCEVTDLNDIESSWHSKSLVPLYPYIRPGIPNACEPEDFIVAGVVTTALQCQKSNFNNCNTFDSVTDFANPNRAESFSVQCDFVAGRTGNGNSRGDGWINFPSTPQPWNWPPPEPGTWGSDPFPIDPVPAVAGPGGLILYGGNGIGNDGIFGDTFPGAEGDSNLQECGCPGSLDGDIDPTTDWIDPPNGGGTGKCCPPGTDTTDPLNPNDCIELAAQFFSGSEDGVFKIAERVPALGGGPATNIFDAFVDNRPFFINLPINPDTAIVEGESAFDKSTESN